MVHSDGQAARVLVVDDDVVLLRNIALWLKADGYDVHAASNGAEALRLVEQMPFDVAVIDLQMPGMSGLELLPKLKALAADLVILVLTGNATMENAIAALRKGQAYDFLQKPLIRPEQLAQAIDQAMAQRQQPMPEDAIPLPAHLTERDLQILNLLAQGLQNKEIASQLGISEKTVRNTLSTIYRKLGICSRTEALRLYHLHGLHRN